MDPLSLAFACATLAGAIAKAAISLGIFVQEVREAQSELNAVSRELSSLGKALDLLVENFGGSTGQNLPSSLQSQIRGIIKNCNKVVTEIETSLRKHGKSRRGRMYWTAGGKGDMAKLRSSLEAHKSALNIALEVSTISIAKDIRQDTEEIRRDTHTVKDDVAKILEEIERLQARLPVDDSQSNASFKLQRYLYDLESYTSSVSDPSEFDRPASQGSSHSNQETSRIWSFDTTNNTVPAHHSRAPATSASQVDAALPPARDIVDAHFSPSQTDNSPDSNLEMSSNSLRPPVTKKNNLSGTGTSRLATASRRINRVVKEQNPGLDQNGPSTNSTHTENLPERNTEAGLPNAWPISQPGMRATVRSHSSTLPRQPTRGGSIHQENVTPTPPTRGRQLRSLQQFWLGGKQRPRRTRKAHTGVHPRQTTLSMPQASSSPSVGTSHTDSLQETLGQLSMEDNANAEDANSTTNTTHNDDRPPPYVEGSPFSENTDQTEAHEDPPSQSHNPPQTSLPSAFPGMLPSSASPARSLTSKLPPHVLYEDLEFPPEFFLGNLVMDLSLELQLPSALHPQLAHRNETTHCRYTAVTCSPSLLSSEDYTFRQELYNVQRETEILAVIDARKWHTGSLADTLKVIEKNVAYLTQESTTPAWGPDSWKRVVVCLVFTAELMRAPHNFRAFLERLGVLWNWEEWTGIESPASLLGNHIRGVEIKADMYEYTTMLTQFAWDNIVGTVPVVGRIPLQMILIVENGLKRETSYVHDIAQILHAGDVININFGEKDMEENFFFEHWKAARRVRLGYLSREDAVRYDLR